MAKYRDLAEMGQQMLADSRQWFPEVHARPNGFDTTLHLALGLAGETGEVIDIIKKADICGFGAECDKHTVGKHSMTALAVEMADVLTYLLALAAHLGIDIEEAYDAKRQENVNRWGPTDRECCSRTAGHKGRCAYFCSACTGVGAVDCCPEARPRHTSPCPDCDATGWFDATANPAPWMNEVDEGSN